jgi:plasmid stability protein
MSGASIESAVSGEAVNTLVLPHRQLQEGLYRPSKAVAPFRRRRLKAVAAAHRRSMNQEAILVLEAGLPESPIPQRPSLAESRRWLEEQVWTLPVLDDRSTEEILGYGDDGFCG